MSRDHQAQETARIYREQRASANAAAQVQAALDRARMAAVRQQQQAAQQR